MGRFGGAIRDAKNLGWFKVRKDGEETSQRCRQTELPKFQVNILLLEAR